MPRAVSLDMDPVAAEVRRQHRLAVKADKQARYRKREVKRAAVAEEALEFLLAAKPGRVSPDELADLQHKLKVKLKNIWEQ